MSKREKLDANADRGLDVTWEILNLPVARVDRGQHWWRVTQLDHAVAHIRKDRTARGTMLKGVNDECRRIVPTLVQHRGAAREVDRDVAPLSPAICR